jgi:hypothetical protein
MVFWSFVFILLLQLMQNEWILYEIKFLENDDEENVVERMFEDEIKVHLIIVQFLSQSSW